MRNIDVIQKMPAAELARLLIRSDHEEDVDYDWDEEPYFSGLQEIWTTSDGLTFLDEEDAVEHEIGWLMEEVKKGESQK